MRKGLGFARVALWRFFLRRRGVHGAEQVRLHGRPWISVSSEGEIRLGLRTVLTGEHRANTLDARGPCVLRTVGHGRILIGDDVGMTSATISSQNRIWIGNRVLIGAGVTITDFDHHDLSVSARDRRYAGLPVPNADHGVIIEDDVFIGARAVVLKGVTIGASSIVGAGSVVVHDIPSGSVAVGNPCRVVGRLLDSDEQSREISQESQTKGMKS